MLVLLESRMSGGDLVREEREHLLFELDVGVEDEGEVSNSVDRSESFFEDITCLVEETLADRVLSQTHPQVTHFISVFPNAMSNHTLCVY